MAYSTLNPPALLTQRVGSGVDGSANAKGGAIWSYASADNAATVYGADYISDAADLGMEVGDAVHVLDNDAPLLTIAFVSAISAAGEATLTGLVLS